jgi:hypothetical protein
MLQGPPHPRAPRSPRPPRGGWILLPSPLWGRGWRASGVIASRGGPGEGVSPIVNSYVGHHTRAGFSPPLDDAGGAGLQPRRNRGPRPLFVPHPAQLAAASCAGCGTWKKSGRPCNGGAKQAAEKLECAVILSIDSRSAAHDRQKLGPRKGSADLFFRSAAFPCPSGTCRGPKKQVRATPAEFQGLTRRVSAEEQRRS